MPKHPTLKKFELFRINNILFIILFAHFNFISEEIELGFFLARSLSLSLQILNALWEHARSSDHSLSECVCFVVCRLLCTLFSPSKSVIADVTRQHYLVSSKFIGVMPTALSLSLVCTPKIQISCLFTKCELLHIVLTRFVYGAQFAFHQIINRQNVCSVYLLCGCGCMHVMLYFGM